ncbi:MAG: Ca2+-dependent phosphoinositide-specific phospholipase C [Acholeplasmataceae bacterium]|nr:Ca2+-dependent phosphoinositide-specific phospholipase C [Acholeplasmataceae bacterium]
MLIRMLKIALISILSLVFIFIFIVMRQFSIKIYDSVVQTRHMKNLEALYDDDYEPIDESSFVNFDRFDDTTTLDQIQMLASHNSYKKMGSTLGRLFVGLGDSFAEARALKYGYNNLTAQFEAGIRSMEFDLRKRKDSFQLTHVPLVDNSSVAPDFASALEEIYLYSSHNPTHIPMIFLVEIKDDWMMLDHALQKMESQELTELNALLKDKLNETLFAPSDMMADGMSLRETIENQGWPTVTSLLGKVIFVLHPSNMNDLYESLDPTLEDLAMFIGAYEDDLAHDYASFVIHNDVDITRIQELVSQKYIVRTRVDESLNFEISRFQDAIASYAQILTSDFTIGRKDIKDEDVITLSQYMVIKKE